uniref:Uncharacterized protein n=1 Tax=Anas platyrhynchos platyrhynchos TaxID=8840 RepID=A0A493TYE9_ANAPP
MPLKPFKYLLPETRFLHAGRLVYKFKIRYGSFKSASELDNTESAVKELEVGLEYKAGIQREWGEEGKKDKQSCMYLKCAFHNSCKL